MRQEAFQGSLEGAYLVGNFPGFNSRLDVGGDRGDPRVSQQQVDRVWPRDSLPHASIQGRRGPPA